MRKYLLLAAIIGGILCMTSVFLAPTVPTTLIHVENSKELVSKLPKVSQLERKIIAAVEVINHRNAIIKSFLSENVDVTIQQDVAIRLRGSIAYEKDRKFRLIIKRKLGAKEADVGSNDRDFWFWSRRHDPPHLYYADHNDVYKSRLKTPFHPLWMMESLSIGNIDLDNAEVSEFEGKWKVSQKRKSTLGQTVIKSTIIDPERLVVIGHYVSTSSGKLVASTEIEEWDGNAPKAIIMRWNDENVSMRLKFNRTKVNSKIAEKNWEMPNIKPKTDMSKD